MTRTLDEIRTAVAGKAIERGLLVENSGDGILIRYQDEDQQSEDHLHRQALRGLVGRVDPEATVRTLSVDGGFLIEVIQKVEEVEMDMIDLSDIKDPEKLIEKLRRLLVAN